VISTACCSNLTGLLEQNSPHRCDNVSDTRVTGEGWLTIIEICEDGVYVVTVVVVAAVMVAVVVVAAMVVESRLVVAVEVGRDASQSRASLGAAAMSLIVVIVMSVLGRWLWLRWG